MTKTDRLNVRLEPEDRRRFDRLKERLARLFGLPVTDTDAATWLIRDDDRREAEKEQPHDD